MPDGRARVVAETLRRYLDDGMIDRAPGLAYYGILSLFPLLMIAFALLRLVAGSDAPEELAAYARQGGASGAVSETLRSAAETAREASAGTAGSAGLAGLLALVYGASRAFTAAGRAMDAIADRSATGRSLARRAQDIFWTLVVLTMASALLVVVLVSGKALEAALDAVGLEDELDTWRLLRWPAAAGIGLAIVAIVRWAAPTRRPPFRLLSPGALVSVGVLIVETIGYDIYVSQIATYNTTYGAFAGAIILMLWVWLGAIAFLFGAELDAVLADRHGAAGGRTPP